MIVRLLIILLSFLSVGFAQLLSTATRVSPSTLQTGAAQTNLYLNDLKGKRVGMVVNHTSRIGATHLVDSLPSLSVTIKTIFAPGSSSFSLLFLA